MSGVIKNKAAILKKLGIEVLNPMQEAAHAPIAAGNDVVLLSSTGTGKTLGFLLPLVEQLDPACAEVQLLILTPSRELAIQIEQVTRNMGIGFKTNAVYGGQSVSKDKLNLKRPPAILIGTPGRVADHMRRQTVSTSSIHCLVLDEFDKSLEIGFEEDMREIVGALSQVKQKVLTSATQGVDIPDFVQLSSPIPLNFIGETEPHIQLKEILSPSKDKLQSLVKALCHIGNHPGIVFCNFKDSIQRLSDYLTEQGISHGCFYGGLEQQDRERALIKFRNGTHQLLIATDLAARGIDIPEIRFIIHYHLPLKEHEFIHRNGRTARMNREGTAYVLLWEEEKRPVYLPPLENEVLLDAPLPSPSMWKTVFISGGRRDKISKGDIAGLFLRQGELNREDLGQIELHQDCAFAGVLASKADKLISLLNNRRLKKKKVRLRLV